MASRSDIHTFALKWIEKFRDRKTDYRELAGDPMGEDCKALGFIMDNARAFSDMYGAASYDSSALRRVVRDINDCMLLGSGIYSRWQYFHHWTYFGADIATPENRHWFLLALERLEALTDGLSGDADEDLSADRIRRIRLEYHRTTRVKPDRRLQALVDYLTWDYYETLLIDRDTQNIEFTQKVGPRCESSRSYHMEQGVSALLDLLDAGTLFKNVKGNPPDAVYDPDNRKEYTLLIDYERHERRVIQGTFDRNGLPDDYMDFMMVLWKFILFFGLGEMFERNNFGKVLRREGESIFCRVVFSEGGKEYFYLADEDIYDERDLVIVPAGEDNEEKIARIEGIEYHMPEDAPYPMEKLKHILRRYEGDEDEDTEDGESDAEDGAGESSRAADSTEGPAADPDSTPAPDGQEGAEQVPCIFSFPDGRVGRCLVPKDAYREGDWVIVAPYGSPPERLAVIEDILPEEAPLEEDYQKHIVRKVETLKEALENIGPFDDSGDPDERAALGAFEKPEGPGEFGMWEMLRILQEPDLEDEEEEEEAETEAEPSEEEAGVSEDPADAPESPDETPDPADPGTIAPEGAPDKEEKESPPDEGEPSGT